MDLRRYSEPLRLGPALVLVIILAVGATAAVKVVYVHEDARITGQEIHSFVDGQENVSIVLGGFRLKLGGRIISGRDAVVWVKSEKVGRISRNEITVFVQGDAAVREPDGSVTTDRTILVILRHQGRLSASGRLSADQLGMDFPLYLKAAASRKGTDVPVKTTTRPKDSPGPVLIRTDDKTPKPPVGDKTPVIYQPVSMRAKGGVTSHEIGKGTPEHRRITIARGNVYLSQGHPDSDEYLDLHSQVAVVFSKPARKSSGPDAGPVGGALGGKETVVGVYLEGDVVIRRGERHFRGSSAYYDFITNRSLMTNAVFRTIQKQRNIFLTIFEGWKFQANYVQTIVEVIPKLPVINKFFQITVSCSDDPDVNLERFIASYSFNGAFL